MGKQAQVSESSATAWAPDGVEREVYLINGQQPGPLIEVDEGDDLEIFVKNDLAVETSIHWHGLLQRGTPQMDGVPGVTQKPIKPGGNFTYRFSVRNEYGFYWYHSHFRTHYSDAFRGALIVHPSPSRARPFETLATNALHRQDLLQAERRAESILLNDWTQESSNTIYARYIETGVFPHCVNSILANGRGRIWCLPEQTQAEKGLSPRGCSAPMMFRSGFDAKSLPPESCLPTTTEYLTIQANQTQGWLALNLVNSGSVSKLSISLDAHSFYVYAADGLYTELREAKVLHISIGQRYSVMIELNQKPGKYALRYATYPMGDMQQVLESQAIVSYLMPNNTSSPTVVPEDPNIIWALTNGSAKTDNTVLDPVDLRPYERVEPPTEAADVTLSFAINQTGIVTWVMSQYSYEEAETPILYGDGSDGWRANTTFHIPMNSTVDVIMAVANNSMDMSGMAVVLVEGEEVLPRLLGPSHPDTSSANETDQLILSARLSEGEDFGRLLMTCLGLVVVVVILLVVQTVAVKGWVSSSYVMLEGNCEGQLDKRKVMIRGGW
ncbi:MAG: hypothetical protein M1817_005074 [Caeruleum heppii]|nr:MAG: hypothetical protein M1817_005074 [Caeruleum heppii]